MKGKGSTFLKALILELHNQMQFSITSRTLFADYTPLQICSLRILRSQPTGLKQKKLSNMKVTVMPIIISPLGTVTQGLEKRLAEFEIRGRIETSQIKALLCLARILRRVLETSRDLLSLRLQGKTTGGRWCKKLAESEMIIII